MKKNNMQRLSNGDWLRQPEEHGFDMPAYDRKRLALRARRSMDELAALTALAARQKSPRATMSPAEDKKDYLRTYTREANGHGTN